MDDSRVNGYGASTRQMKYIPAENKKRYQLSATITLPPFSFRYGSSVHATTKCQFIIMTDPAAAADKPKQGHRVHYSSLEELIEHHPDIFKNEAKFDLWGTFAFAKKRMNKRYNSLSSFFLLERPILHRQVGVLAECTVRTPFNEPNPTKWLRRAFLELQSYYGGRITCDITTTCNAVLSHNQSHVFNVWYGHSFGPAGKDTIVNRAVLARNPAEAVAKVPSKFYLEDFATAITNRLDGSDVSVELIVNICFILRAFLPSVPAPAKATRKLTKRWGLGADSR